MGTKDDELKNEVDEAQNYVNDTLTYWRQSGENKKVLTLAKTAKN